MSDEVEVWKQIEAPWSGYEISSFGRVRNLRNGRYLSTVKGHSVVLQPDRDSEGGVRQFSKFRLYAKYFPELQE